ncbi:MAG: branched-chain amino acid transport system permease protein [Candidatus Eremiobacteraeota bacterium]|jgi:branched-chain amino acid transport system permease protein|nr:branched-chain amino acid transport system permease protein [Candidatus Eremiobacteraeota bacterium]MEA2718371.1 branched-chain amino acid transport system permease protein [Candidatus Eremiobacteraeota bacterium]
MTPRVRMIGLAVLLVLLIALPFIKLTIPGLFGGSLDAPGTLNLLGLCFVFGALALTYDLVFGYVGLLSFGHALYFATGVYVTAVAMARWHWSLPQALALTAVVSLVLPLVLGAVCLRMRDIPFAMVTLAFAQAGSILVMQNPFGLTGGEEGVALGGDTLPSFLVGVANTHNVYWIALVLLLVVYAIAWRAVNSPPGRVWQAIRENERRVEVLGLNPYLYKLGAFVLSAFLASATGVVYLLLQGGANPEVTTSGFTLALLVMVVLGGVGTLWGAVLGGIVYEYLDFRLVALANTPAVQSLPGMLKVPLSEPLFLLGVLFIVLVLFVPGGLGGVLRRRTAG